jgi:glucoamylase
MFSLMLRNVSTYGWIFKGTSGRESQQGCIIAAPSHPPLSSTSLDVTDQDYVFNWTRDAAITAAELAAFKMATPDSLEDYVSFADLTQTNCPNKIGFACFRVDGTPRNGSDPNELNWNEQSDGPALQVMAILAAWSQLSAPSQATAKQVIVRDLAYLLGAYQAPTINLWEETEGYSIFARAVQLRCFRDLIAKASLLGLSASDKSSLQSAITNLTNVIADHWDASKGRYRSILNSGGRGADLNADAVMASVYGGISCTDPKLLATAAQIRDTFKDLYMINSNDAALKLGPNIGRYPEDEYDGDMGEPPNEGQPWAPCTCNFAEFYYMVAAEIAKKRAVSVDALSKPFFDGVGITANSSVSDAISLLRAAGDAMLGAVVYHSDHLELSEQIDRYNGFEKSVRNLSWSYASFLSAVRARKRIP